MYSEFLCLRNWISIRLDFFLISDSHLIQDQSNVLYYLPKGGFSVINLGGDTFGKPIFQKGLQSQPSSPHPDFSNKKVLKLKLPKIVLSKNVRLNSYSSMKKKSKRF